MTKQNVDEPISKLLDLNKAEFVQKLRVASHLELGMYVSESNTCTTQRKFTETLRPATYC